MPGTRIQSAEALRDSPADPLPAPKHLLAVKLNDLLEATALSQAEVARLLGMSQPKISAIRNHKLKGISLQRLMQALTALGQRVEIVVTPSTDPSRARIDVAA